MRSQLSKTERLPPYFNRKIFFCPKPKNLASDWPAEIACLVRRWWRLLPLCPRTASCLRGSIVSSTSIEITWKSPIRQIASGSAIPTPYCQLSARIVASEPSTLPSSLASPSHRQDSLHSRQFHIACCHSKQRLPQRAIHLNSNSQHVCTVLKPGTNAHDFTPFTYTDAKSHFCVSCLRARNPQKS